MSGPTFEEVWAEYAGETFGKEFTAFHVPEEFSPAEYDEVGYIPPKRRPNNEPYNWSKFHDFWRWLVENGFLEVAEVGSDGGDGQ